MTLRVHPMLGLLVGVMAVTAAVGGADGGVLASPRMISPTRAGDVMIVEPGDPTEAITNGGSDTEFALHLPEGAACPGDSANDQWRVQTFLVPVADDPGALRYGEIGPEGDGRWSVYDLDTRPYVHGLTEANAAAGSPGRIGPLPVFSFAVFPPGVLPAGAYRIGVACTLTRQTAVYWDTELTLTVNTGGDPAHLSWRTPEAPISGGDDSGGSGRLALGLSATAAAAIAAVGVVIWRRSHRSLRLSKEMS